MNRQLPIEEVESQKGPEGYLLSFQSQRKSRIKGRMRLS
jgi:hypothetical protein